MSGEGWRRRPLFYSGLKEADADDDDDDDDDND